MSLVKATPIIIDCDPGNDDAWAIISILKCEEKLNLKLKALSIVIGNTSVENGAQNALLLLKAFNRMDIPVFAGAGSALIKKSEYPIFHGDDGFCDIYHDKPSRDLVQKKHAVEGLKDLIEEVLIYVLFLICIAFKISEYP